jgi:hypothetical protein
MRVEDEGVKVVVIACVRRVSEGYLEKDAGLREAARDGLDEVVAEQALRIGVSAEIAYIERSHGAIEGTRGPLKF